MIFEFRPDFTICTTCTLLHFNAVFTPKLAHMAGMVGFYKNSVKSKQLTPFLLVVAWFAFMFFLMFAEKLNSSQVCAGDQRERCFSKCLCVQSSVLF